MLIANVRYYIKMQGMDIEFEYLFRNGIDPAGRNAQK